ncbi:Adenylate cyclase 2 [Phycisphaerae bacterium RAS1]|nr:Adenylate cyclase 2 [Phycisphaerae bacterium RAS1]
MSRKQRQANLQTTAIGLIACAVVLALYLAGALEWLESKTLDLRFRYSNSIPQHPDIAMIDIDDATLLKTARWPWPRDKQAALINIPAELGARRLLVDITWNERETLREDLPDEADIAENPLDLGDASFGKVWPDYELRDALQRAGNAYLALHYDAQKWDRAEDFDRVVDAVRSGKPPEAAVSPRLRSAPGLQKRVCLAARIVCLLEKQPDAEDCESIARSLTADVALVREVFERSRQYALREYIQRSLAARADLRMAPPWETIRLLYDGLNVSRAFQDPGGLKTALITAHREVLSYEATVRNPLFPARAVAAIAPTRAAIVPVYFVQAQAARRCGFVAFEPDDDGVMRRNSVFATHRGNLLTQLALAVGCDELGVSADRIRVEPDRLVLRPEGARPPIQIQLDRQGRTYVPWISERDPARHFGQHIPADMFWSIHASRQQIAQNLQYLRQEREELFSSEFAPHPTEHKARVARLREAEAAVRRARYSTPADPAAADAQLAAALAELTDFEEAQVADVRRRLAAPGPGDDAENLQLFLDQLPSLETLGRYVADTNRRLEADVASTLAWLRPRIANKICLVGYTATSLADMTPIPTNKRAPGVLAHANFLNGLLTGRMVYVSSTATNLTLAAAFGALMAILGAWLRPRTSVALMALGIIAYFAAAAWLFYSFTYFVGVVPVAGAMFAAYAAVAIYRFIFVDRERRQLTTALSQYTSATLARQMAENAELCRRAETREVTAMFTDLAGFTTISERIGAERTQRVLNVSLGCFSEAMLVHEAMINKFIGDGIFAFWNPVIHPQEDHAQRACATAVDLMKALRALIEEQKRLGAEPVFSELVLRVGVATGNAVVGPCGSEQKYDYTCIGDSVNVAARLESANKFYGTRIIVSGSTRSRVDGQFAFRPLGNVQVKGKHTGVPIFELMGLVGDVTDEQIAYAQAFGEAIELFKQRRFADARRAFEACSARRPEDTAAQRYVEVTAHYEVAPPAEDWNGAIELTEK